MDEPTRSAPIVQGETTVEQSVVPPTMPDAIEPIRKDTMFDVPGYEMLGPLGEGGMGIVWKARHEKLNRLVAIKMIRGGENVRHEELTRFLKEAESVAAIRHPNVVQVYDISEVDGGPYLAMEYLQGGTLVERLRQEGKLSPKVCAMLISKLAKAVHAAHEKQIVHRDLKPANVIFDEHGEPKITDFGLAKRMDGGDLTRTNAVMGTPSYMAPEQAKGESKFVGPEADIWALGVMIYECLTGKKPFSGNGAIEIMTNVLGSDPPDPRLHVSSLPRDLVLICLKCLRKQPGERYASALELSNDLERFLEGKPVSAVPYADESELGWPWLLAAAATPITFVACVIMFAPEHRVVGSLALIIVLMIIGILESLPTMIVILIVRRFTMPNRKTIWTRLIGQTFLLCYISRLLMLVPGGPLLGFCGSLVVLRRLLGVESKRVAILLIVVFGALELYMINLSKSILESTYGAMQMRRLDPDEQRRMIMDIQN